MKTPDMPENNTKTESLLDLLAQATERKPEPNDNAAIRDEIEQETIKPNADDFAEVIEEENKENIDNHSEEQNTPPEKTEPVKPSVPPEVQAEMLIGFVDGVQSIVLPFAYQKSAFTKNEKEKLKELARRMKESGETSLSEEDQSLMSTYNDVKELIESIPFADNEIAMIKNPLIQVIKKYNWSIGPEMMLAGSMFAVMSTRLIPLFSKLEKIGM